MHYGDQAKDGAILCDYNIIISSPDRSNLKITPYGDTEVYIRPLVGSFVFLGSKNGPNGKIEYFAIIGSYPAVYYMRTWLMFRIEQLHRVERFVIPENLIAKEEN
jgi:hypothetical protein